MRDVDDRELRRLSRRDLMGLLEELSRENDRLRAELDEANRRLEDRRAQLDRCGSIAQASLVLGGVFEAADRAAQAYVESVKLRVDRAAGIPGEEAAASEERPDDKAGEGKGLADDAPLDDDGQPGAAMAPEDPEASEAAGAEVPASLSPDGFAARLRERFAAKQHGGAHGKAR